MMTGDLCDPDALAALARAGDVAALDRASRCFGDKLLAVGRRHCRSEEEARDAVQDALLQAGLHLEQYRGDGRFDGWIARMVAHACARMRRGRKNDPGLHDAGAEVTCAESPEEAAARAELAAVIASALVELSPADRAVVILADLEGWSGPQVAEKLGLRPDAARARLSRARRRLREALAARGVALEREES